MTLRFALGWLASIVCFITLASAKLLFVNEVCRHGARAPEVDGSADQFPNGKGMLTASGMRQHYMIGHQLRKRYVSTQPDDDKLLSQKFKHDEVYVRSTQYPRTIQSAESQMFGMYPLGSSNPLPAELIDVSVPPLEIHNKDEILKKLGTDPIPGRFQPIAIHNFGLYIDDMVAYGNCPYMVNDYVNRSKNPEIWQKYDKHFRPLIYKQIAAAFNITADDIDFQEIYPLSDILWAEDFEGIQNRYNFNEKEWDILKQIQLPCLVELLSDNSNKIMVSRMINPVVEMMKSKIGLSYNQTLVSSFKKAKFLLFSSHDYQLSHILKFLAPTNVNIKWIDYASILLYELHSKDTAECYGSKAKDCYIVKVFYNNDQLKLPGCAKLDCTFSEFEAYIAAVGFDYKKIDEFCNSEESLPEAKNVKLFEPSNMFLD